MLRKVCLMLALAVQGTALLAQEPARTVVIPAGMSPAYDEWHYAPALRVGDTVIVSGVPASGPPDATYETKVRTMFERVRTVLKAAGADMADVVELTTFHREPKDTDSFQKEFAVFQKVHHEFFTASYPAWTAVGTTALLSPSAPVEMRVMAIVGSGKNVAVKREPAPSPSPKP